MKKRVLSIFALVMALTCLFVPVLVSASEAEYTKTENYTVPFDKMSSHENSLALTEETLNTPLKPKLNGKTVVKISKNTEEGAGRWCYLHFGEANNSLNVKISDYKYMVVKIYYELDKFQLGSGNNIPLFHRSTAANPADSNKSYFKAKELLEDGTMIQHGVRQDNWLYLIYDLSVVDSQAQYTDTTAYPNGKDDTLNSTWFYPFCNGAGGVENANMDKDVAYMQFATFTNDAAGLIAADKKADAEALQKPSVTEPPVQDATPAPSNPSGGSANTAAPATNAPKADDEKGGCGSSVALGSVALLTVGGTLIIARKKKKH